MEIHLWVASAACAKIQNRLFSAQMGKDLLPKEAIIPAIRELWIKMPIEQLRQ
jgi:hypothetical protein